MTPQTMRTVRGKPLCQATEQHLNWRWNAGYLPACCCSIFRVQCIKEYTGHQRHQCHKQISSLHYNCCLRRWRLWLKLPLEKKGTANIISPGTTRWFLPLFKYADIIWDNCTTTQASTLENLHLEAIGIIISSVRRTYHHNSRDSVH